MKQGMPEIKKVLNIIRTLPVEVAGLKLDIFHEDLRLMALLQERGEVKWF